MLHPVRQHTTPMIVFVIVSRLLRSYHSISYYIISCAAACAGGGQGSAADGAARRRREGAELVLDSA